MTAVAVDLIRDCEGWPPEGELAALAERALAAAGAKTPRFPGTGDVSILFTDDARMAELNRTWRGIPGPTNVLSFPAPAMPGSRETPALGDIALGFETVTKEAAEAHLTLADHISHLLVHGFLHLIGYDHRDDAEAAVMESLEIAILAGLGIADPYGREPEPIDAAASNRR